MQRYILRTSRLRPLLYRQYTQQFDRPPNQYPPSGPPPYGHPHNMQPPPNQYPPYYQQMPPPHYQTNPNMPPPFDLPPPPPDSDDSSTYKQEKKKINEHNDALRPPKIFFMVLSGILMYEITIGYLFFRSSNLVDEEILPGIKDKRHKYSEQQLNDAVPLLKSLIFILAKEGYHKEMFQHDFVAKVLNLYFNALDTCGAGSKPSRYAGLLISSLAANDFEQFSEELVKLDVPRKLIEKILALQTVVHSQLMSQVEIMGGKPITIEDVTHKIANLHKVSSEMEFMLKTMFTIAEKPHVHDQLVQNEQFLETLKKASDHPNLFVSTFVAEFLLKVFHAEVRDITGKKNFETYLLNNSRYVNSIKIGMQSVLEVHQKNMEKLHGRNTVVQDQSPSTYIDETVNTMDELAATMEKEKEGDHSTIVHIGTLMKMAIYSGLAIGYVGLRGRFNQAPKSALRTMGAYALIYTIAKVNWDESLHFTVRKMVLRLFERRDNAHNVVVSSPRLHFVTNQFVKFMFTKFVFLSLWYRAKYLFFVALMLNGSHADSEIDLSF